MKSTIVIEIDEQMIKWMAASAGAKPVITHAGLMSVDHLADDQIAKNISQQFRLNKMPYKQSRIIVMLPRSKAILRHLTLPSQDAAEIESMVGLQAVHHIPYTREEVEIGFHVLERTTDGYSKVLAVIIPHEIAMRYWRIFELAQIPVHGMTISSEGMWRYAESTGRLGGAEVLAMVDVDTQRSEICLCRKDAWLTSRDINIGHQQMSQEGPAGLIRQWDLTISNAIKEKLISRIQQVCLLSNGVSLVPLAEELRQWQECEVRFVDVLEGISVVKSLKWPMEWQGQSMGMAAILGMVLCAQGASINLIPTRVLQQQGDDRQKKDSVILALVSIVTVVSLILAGSMGYLRKSSQLGALEGEYRRYNKQAEAVKVRVDQIKHIENIFSHRLIVAQLIQVLYGVMPQQMSLVNITINDGQKLSINGFSTKVGNIHKLQSAMVGNRFFDQIELDYMNKRVTQDGEVNYFKITAQVGAKNE